MDVYSLDGEPKDKAAGHRGAGTFKTWRRIDPPAWAATAELRPLDDTALDDPLARLNRKRHKTGTAREPKPEVERVRLKVPYERKDEAKKLGARWSPADRAWWLPADKTEAMAKARDLGFTSS
jgi:hypothetical protein